MNQVTAKKMIKRIREIENITKKKFSRTKWINDRVRGIALITSSSTQLSADPTPKSRILGLERVELLDLFGWVVGDVGDVTSPSVST